jgi:hypothetical protein
MLLASTKKQCNQVQKREVKKRREHNKEKLNPKTREKGRGGKKRIETGSYLASDNIEDEQGSG